MEPRLALPELAAAPIRKHVDLRAASVRLPQGPAWHPCLDSTETAGPPTPTTCNDVKSDRWGHLPPAPSPSPAEAKAPREQSAQMHKKAMSFSTCLP